MISGVHVPGSSRRLSALRAIGIVAAAGLLWLTFADVEFDKVSILLQQAGPGVLLAWAAFALAYALDIEAWRGLLRLLGHRVSARVALGAHVCGEAAMMSLPLGVVVAEPMRAYLLRRNAGVPVAAGVAATAARKYLIMASEGAVVGLGAIVGADVLAHVSLELTGTTLLPWISWAISAVLLLIAASYGLLLRSGAVAQRCLSLATRITPARFTSALERAKLGFAETDAALGRFFRLPPARIAGPFLLYVGVWLLEAFETYVVLRLLGVEVGFGAALCVEGVLVFIRSAVAIFPAGLGAQDLGYVMFLRALGVPDALDIGAAFVLLKRLKEAMWIAVGYGVLVLGSGSTRPAWAPLEVNP